MNSNRKGGEDVRRLEALLTAAYRAAISEVSDDEAAKFFEEPVRLSEEDEATISTWGNGVVNRLLGEGKILLDVEETSSAEIEMEYFALNRDREGKGLDEEIQRRIDEERLRALEEEKRRAGEKDDDCRDS